MVNRRRLSLRTSARERVSGFPVTAALAFWIADKSASGKVLTIATRASSLAFEVVAFPFTETGWTNDAAADAFSVNVGLSTFGRFEGPALGGVEDA